MKRPRILIALLACLMLLILFPTAVLADKVEIEYKLIFTDQNGREVINPRTLNAGDTLNVEIELKRKDSDAASYNTYGLEFRLLTRGLEYNGDGASFHNGTPITKQVFMSGDSVGFAYYDMERVGVPINNPVLAGRWSYTVVDPSKVNITVPVALMYIVNDSESHELVGNARLYLDPNGGEIIGEDVSGEYPSGTAVKLPDASFAEYKFVGWSDGARIWNSGDTFTVTGVITLTAVWEGLVRNRQVLFEPNGGTFKENDPSGMYAEGEIIKMPEAEKDGFELSGWRKEGKLFKLGEEYVVDNSVIFFAEWIEPSPNPPQDDDNNGLNIAIIAAISAAGALGIGIFLWLILWKRRYVLYSLENGDVALSYKEKDHRYQVEVILYGRDDEGRSVEYHLNKSGTVEAKHRLRFIHGQEDVYPIVEVKPGRYKGKLIVTDPKGGVTEEKARIKVLDREIRERENR